MKMSNEEKSFFKTFELRLLALKKILKQTRLNLESYRHSKSTKKKSSFKTILGSNIKVLSSLGAEIRRNYRKDLFSLSMTPRTLKLDF